MRNELPAWAHALGVRGYGGIPIYDTTHPEPRRAIGYYKIPSGPPAMYPEPSTPTFTVRITGYEGWHTPLTQLGPCISVIEPTNPRACFMEGP